MSEPKDYQEYLDRFSVNNGYEGFGFDTKMRMPCPFCAAPDWLHVLILDAEKHYAKGATCKECGRSARAIFTHAPGSTTFEFVQTAGPDQPDWLPQKMRRVP